jgi:Kef-type K+ transport system membrane component KefB
LSRVVDSLLIRDLGLMLLAAAGALLLARRARVPSIIIYIITGLVLGPVTGLVAVTDTVHLIAEFGIALLLFLVGLELSFDKIRDVGRVAVIAGLGQVVFTAVGGVGLSLLLGFSLMEAVFIGTALTFSSTIVVVKLLNQKGDLDALYGRIAVGIFLVQDLVVIIVLTFLAGLGAGESLTVGYVSKGVILAFGGMALLLAGVLLASRFVLPPVFAWLSASLEGLFIVSLCWCFLVVLTAEAMALSVEIGAFLAGISLAQLPFNRELRRRVHPLMNFFIAIFFVSLGLQLQLADAGSQLLPALALALFVLIGNPLIFLFIIAGLGYDVRTSFLTSVTVAQISEFSFIFAAMGVSAALIGEPILSVVAVVGVVTIGVSSYMILHSDGLFGLVDGWGLLRPFRALSRGAAPPAAPPALDGHIIVAGMNSLGRRLVHELAGLGAHVVAIDTDHRKLDGLPATTILGSVDHDSVLAEARIENARLVVSALQIEDSNRLLAYRCRELGIPASIHAFDISVQRDLREIGVAHLILSKHAGIRLAAAELRAAGLLP